MEEDAENADLLTEDHDLEDHETESEFSNRRANSESCSNVLCEEFRLKNFGFRFGTVEVFHASQWCWPRIVFVLYRVVVALYAVVVTVTSIVFFDAEKWRHPWPVWLTNWSYFILTCHLVCSATIALLSATGDGRINRKSGRVPLVPFYDEDTPLYAKTSWFLFSVASSSAIIVTIIYFVAIYPQIVGVGMDVENVNLHAMNTVVVLLEFAISAIPVRLLHFVYVLTFAAVYTAFSAIYWSTDHSNVLYPGVLDWNDPGKTVVVVSIVGAVGVPLIQAIFFAAYRLRLFAYRRIYGVNHRLPT